MSGSPGTWITPRGPVQGEVIIDPATGLPIKTTNGGLNVNATAVIGDVILSAQTSSIAIANPSTLTPLLVEADGSINVNTSVQATQGDSILMVGTENGTVGGMQHVLEIDSNLNAHVINMGSLVPKIFDDISITYGTIDSQTVATLIQYYVGGLSGTLVATLTLSYDSNANLTNIQRT